MNRWANEGANTLWLLTPEEFTELPNGIVLESITGEFVTKGIDYIDDDTRWGHMAYGVRNPLAHPTESERFSFWILRG